MDQSLACKKKEYQGHRRYFNLRRSTLETVLEIQKTGGEGTKKKKTPAKTSETFRHWSAIDAPCPRRLPLLVVTIITRLY